MKLKNKIKSGYRILHSSIFHTNKPVAARINLTNRCTNRCKYCNVWKNKTKEMTTSQIINLLDELKKEGIQRISFSGGEPLLRKDIVEILNYSSKIGISTSINTTGFNLKKIIDKINIDLIKFSIDGDKNAHDLIRGEGSHKITFDAIRLARKRGIKFSFSTTLTKTSTNIKNINYLINLARKYNSCVAFQPLKYMYKGAKDLKNIAPDKLQYSNIINYLIKLKPKNKKFIRNSMQGLYHIKNWPKYERLKCFSKDLFFVIYPNGDLVSCDRTDYPQKNIPNVLDYGFKQAYEKLKKTKCEGCGFCGALEINYLANHKYKVLDEIINITN